MPDDTDLLKATSAYAVERPWRSWWCVLSTLLLLGLSLYGIYLNQLLWLDILFSVLSGLLLVRMFVIYHDHQHGAILRESRIGRVLMWCYGIFTLAANSVWKDSHNYHHANNSKLRGAHIGSYPIMTADKFVKKTAAEKRKYLFMRHPLTILFGYVFIFHLGMCLVPFLNKPKRHFDCIIACVFHVMLCVLTVVFLGWLALLFMLIIPFFIMSAFAAYFFYAQHNFPGASFVRTADWSYVGAAMRSTSFMKLNPLLHWFSANIGYHHIHHLNARIPFYRLPEVMADFEELQQPLCTSLWPWEIWRCLRLKVCDINSGKLIPLSELPQVADQDERTESR